VYKWRTHKGFLLTWITQPACLINLASSVLNAGLHLVRDGIYIKSVGVLWILVGLCWTALSVLTAYEQDRYLWRSLREVFGIVKDVAEVQQQMITWNNLQARLVELDRSQTDTLAANTAKKLGIDKSELLPEQPIPEKSP
jgi:hypothetical protein